MALPFQTVGTSGSLDPWMFQSFIREILSSGLHVTLWDFNCNVGVGYASGCIVYFSCKYINKLYLSLVFRDAFPLLEREKFHGLRAEYITGYCFNGNVGSCWGNTHVGHAIIMVRSRGSGCGVSVPRASDGICDMSCFLEKGTLQLLRLLKRMNKEP